MKSYIFGGLTLVTFMVTIGTYSTVFGRLENQTKEGSPSYRLFVGPSEPKIVFKAELVSVVKATSLTAVGWEGCSWCQRFKETTLPALVKEGYDVKYTDKSLWKGPRITTGPTLFFYGKNGVIVKVYRGYMTPDQVKQWLVK